MFYSEIIKNNSAMTNKKNFLCILSILVALFLGSCNHMGNKQEDDSLNIELVLQRYLDALINGNADTISKYFYKDAQKHIVKFSEYENFDSFVEDILVNQAKLEKEKNDKNGFRHFYQIERRVDQINIKGYEITTFVVTNNLVQGSKNIADTIRIIAFQKASEIEFITISDKIETFLSYKFSKSEIETILNSALEGKYENYLTDINTQLFKEQVWLLEAMGNSVDKLVKIDRVKNDLIRDGFGELPQTFLYLPSYKKIQISSIAGASKLVDLSLSAKTITLPFQKLDNNINYEIEESGIGMYYLYLYYTDGKDNLVFAYHSYSK